jgi:hypothetical protein
LPLWPQLLRRRSEWCSFSRRCGGTYFVGGFDCITSIRSGKSSERFVYHAGRLATSSQKKPTATGFFTLAASRRGLIIGYARVSTTEQNLGLRHDDLALVFDASVDPNEARNARTADIRRSQVVASAPENVAPT